MHSNTNAEIFYDRSLDSVVMVNDEEYQILKLWKRQNWFLMEC